MRGRDKQTGAVMRPVAPRHRNAARDASIPVPVWPTSTAAKAVPKTPLNCRTALLTAPPDPNRAGGNRRARQANQQQPDCNAPNDFASGTTGSDGPALRSRGAPPRPELRSKAAPPTSIPSDTRPAPHAAPRRWRPRSGHQGWRETRFILARGMHRPHVATATDFAESLTGSIRPLEKGSHPELASIANPQPGP